MSKTVDQRVVEMRFDNKHFEENVQTSISSLDKLKKSLDLEGASKGLENVGKAAANVDVSSIGEAVEAVKIKFSAFEVMAITALSNLTNKAVDVGLKLAQSLSTDQISAGWGKYADKTSAVQTIMAATAKDFTDTGEQMEYVNGQLEKLNWFTDETSYNFLDMVSNIGKFTSNNVKLDTAVTAMQGISSWAAISGANTGEASRAMYNLSQAIAVGAVKLQDWKSIENANMATAGFKETAIQTAIELGTLREVSEGVFETVEKGSEVTVANFNSALQDGWFTSEVLLKTLGQYGNFSDKLYDACEKTGLSASEFLSYINDYKDGTIDMASISEETEVSVSELKEMFEELGSETYSLGQKSFRAAQEAKTFGEALDSVKDAVSTGWMNTFEIVFGNYEEAKVLWTDLANELYDIFAEGGNARNELLAAWKERGGRDDLIASLWNVIHGIRGIIKPLKDAFHEIFPPATVDQVVSFTSKLKELTEKFKLSDETAENLKNTFKGLFSILDIIKTILGKLFGAFKPVVGLFGSASGGVLGLTGSFGKWLTKLSETIKTSEKVEVIFTRLASAIGLVVEFLKDFVGDAKVSFVEGGEGFSGVLEIVFDKLADISGLIFNIISALTGKDLSSLKDRVITGIQKIRNKIVDVVFDIQQRLGLQNGVFETIKEKISSFLEKVKELFNGFKKVDTSGIDKLSDKTNTAFKPILSLFDGIKKILGALWEAIKKIAPLIKILATWIGQALGKIGEVVGGAIKNADYSKLMDIANGGVLIAIGLAIKKFFDSAKGVMDKLSGFKDSILGVIDGVKGVLNGVKDTLVTYQKDIKATTILKIASALGILALSVLLLSSIDNDELMQALMAISLLFVELTTSMKAISKMSSISIKNTAFLIGFSVAVLLLASAMKKLADIDFAGLIKGLGGIAGISFILTKVAKSLSNNSGDLMKGALGLIAFAIAIRLLVKPIKELGALDFGALIQGLIGLGALLAELVLFLKFADFDGISLGKGIGIIALAAGIVILAKAVQMFANIKFSSMIKGLLGVGVVLAEVAIFMKLTQDNKGLFKTAAGMIVLGAAMLIFGKAIKNIGSMNLATLAKGLIGMAAALTIIIVAVKKMPNAGKMLASGAALIVIGAAMKIFASAVSSFGSMSLETLAKGLGAMAIALAEVVIAMKFMDAKALAGAAAVLVCAAALAIFVPILQSIGAMSLGEIGKALLAIAGVFVILGVAGYALAPVAPVIMSLAKSLALIGAASLLAGAGLLLISLAIGALAAGAEAAVKALIVIITKLIVAIPEMLSALAKSLTDSIPAIVECLVAIISALLQAIEEAVPQAVETLLVVVEEVLISLANHIPQIVESLLDIVAGILNGLAAGIPKVIYAVVNLVRAIVESLIEAVGELDFGELLLAIAEATVVFTALSVLMALITVVALEAVATSALLPLIGQNLNKFITEIQPFLTEIQNVDPASLQGAKNLAEMILILTAAGIMDALTSWFTGGNSIIEFGKDLVEFAPYLKDYYNGIKGIDGGVVEASANAAKALAEFATHIPNSGGLISLIAGDNSLADFAEELVVFGPKLKEYADSVKGLDAEVVLNSTYAAQALSELASNLPNSGGLVSLLAGDNSLADFAEELSVFGPKLKEYADSVYGLDADIVVSSANAAMALAELATNLPNSGGVVSWFAGDNSLSDFAEELATFGPKFADYANSIKDITNIDVVTASANAATALAKMATELPNSGGVVSWFAGDNSLADFAEELAAFGPKFADYANSIKDITNIDVVTASADAALSLAKMASELPNSGGVVSWFAGDNSLSDFAEELKAFGPEFAEYAKSISGITNIDVVTASADAALSLAKMASELPNSGGVVSWFTGDTSLKDFAEELKEFGPVFCEYAESISGITNLDVVTASADAALSLAKLASELPNSGGVVSWFAGDNSLASFAEELKAFAPEFVSYAKKVSEIEDLDVVTASTDAAMSLAKLANNLPESGGVFSWFTGEQSLSDFAEELSKFAPKFVEYAEKVNGIQHMDVVTASADAALALGELASKLPEDMSIENLAQFGEELAAFGPHFKNYADSIQGITDFSIVDASINTAKSLAELANALPRDGGAISYFIGNKRTLADFADELKAFAPAFKEYADEISGIENMNAIETSVAVATSLLELSNSLPRDGSFMEIFIGKKRSLADFAEEMKAFAPGFKEYAEDISGIENMSVIESSIAVANSLLELSNNLPSDGGFLNMFVGKKQTLTEFGKELASFGPYFKSYADNVGGIENIEVVESSGDIAKALAEFTNNLPTSNGLLNKLLGEKDIVKFGENLSAFGEKFKDYAGKISNVDTTKLNAVTKELNEIVTVAKGMTEINLSSLTQFGMALGILAQNGINDFIAVFTDAKSRIQSTAEGMIDNFSAGITNKKQPFIKYFVSMVSDLIAVLHSQTICNSFKTIGSNYMTSFLDGIKDKYAVLRSAASSIVLVISSELRSNDNYNIYYNTGVYLVDGFVDGINVYAYKAETAARNMARSAIKGAKDELEIASPSKVFHRFGDYSGVAFVGAIEDYADKAYNAASGMGEKAKEGMSDAIKKVSKYIMSEDFNNELTIRPVLDLSEIQNGTSQLFSMMSDVNGYSVSGSVSISDKVSEIMSSKSEAGSQTDKLIKDLGQMINDAVEKSSNTWENTFNINGDNAKDIAEEVSRIIQRQVERRTRTWE